MTLKVRHLVLVCCLVSGFNANALEQWLWKDLVPDQSKTFVDPFATFSSKQKYDLYIVMNYLDSHDPEKKLEYESAVQRFSDDDIEILSLIKQGPEIARLRQAAQHSINESLIGQQGRLAGYIVPLEMDGMLVTQFLLVPTAGACVHTPPPPANQIVLVSSQEGIELTNLYTPVWVEGELNTGFSKSGVQLSDGLAEVDTAYTMRATLIELYQ